MNSVFDIQFELILQHALAYTVDTMDEPIIELNCITDETVIVNL